MFAMALSFKDQHLFGTICLGYFAEGRENRTL